MEIQNIRLLMTYREIMKQSKGFHQQLEEQLWNLQIERENYENDKLARIKANKFLQGDVVKINIGGTKTIAATKKVLCSVKGSVLEQMFSGIHKLHKINDEVFVDRDATTFEMVINYLRNGRKSWPEFASQTQQELFAQELKFWGIKDDTLDELKSARRFDPLLAKVLREVPGEVQDTPPHEEERGGEKIHYEALDTWKKNGPIKLSQLLKHTIVPVDTMLKFCQTEQNQIKMYGQGVKTKRKVRKGQDSI